MRILGIFALLAASNMFAVTITVTPTSGPDFGATGIYTSPSFATWASNALSGLINNTTPGSGTTAYVPIANGSTVSPTAFISTSTPPAFDSWQGIAPGPYAGEQGNALYFSLKVIGSAQDTFRVTDLAAQETYLGQLQLPWVAGDFDEFNFKMIGRRADNGNLTGGGEDNSILLTELYYVGLGFVQPLDLAASGTNQDKINTTVANVLNLKDKTTQVCYSIGNTSNCGSVNVDAPSGVPEPGTYLLFGAGLAGIAFLRRRSA